MSDENLKIILPKQLYRKIEKDICKLYKEFNIEKIPIDICDIAEKMGYEVIPVHKDDPIYGILVEKECDGLMIELRDRKVIYYKADQTKGRQRFTIAHEIAHIRMGHYEESDLANRIANHYASYLLAPEILIFLTKCNDYIELAEVFNVTLDCAWILFASYNRWKNLSNYRVYEIRIAAQFGFNITNTPF